MKRTGIRGRRWISSGLIALALAVGFGGDTATVTYACGGFFCQLVPINQAGQVSRPRFNDHARRARVASVDCCTAVNFVMGVRWMTPTS